MSAAARLGGALILVAGAAFAQKTVEVKLGDLRASYSLYTSAAAVCDAEPQWLAEELHSVNRLLDGFLQKGTTRNGAWTEAQLPLLEDAARVLPAMVEAQDLALTGLAACELRSRGLFPDILARGVPLVKEARQEVGRLPELIRFTRHRVLLDRWERERVEAQGVARKACTRKDPSLIYFAFQDEFGVRRWLLCDGGTVVAPPGKPWEHQAGEGTKADAKQATLRIQRARMHPESALLKAPAP